MVAHSHITLDWTLPACEHTGWDYEKDLHGFPSPPALKSLQVRFKPTLYGMNKLSLPLDLGGKLMNLVLELDLRRTLYRQSQLNRPLDLGGRISDLWKPNLLDRGPKGALDPLQLRFSRIISLLGSGT